MPSRSEASTDDISQHNLFALKPLRPPTSTEHHASHLETSSCGEWSEVISDGGPSTIQAAQTEPPVTFGDEIIQIDSETVLPGGIRIYSRGVSVRRGRDVLRINYTSLTEYTTHAGAADVIC